MCYARHVVDMYATAMFRLSAMECMLVYVGGVVNC